MDYQLEQKDSYGTKEWFEKKFQNAADTGEDLWGHQWRANQQNRYQLTLDFIKNVVNQTNKQKILDIGCGLGDFTNLVLKENPNNQLYGVDISQNAIVAAEKIFPNITFKVGALPDIPFSHKLDGIIALECICYLDDNGRKKAIENFFDQLNSNGWVAISSAISNDKKYFTEAKFIEIFEQNGFAIKEITRNFAKAYNKFEQKPLFFIQNISNVQNYAKGKVKQVTKNQAKLASLVKTPLLGSLLQLGLNSLLYLSKKTLQSQTILSLFQSYSKFKGDDPSHVIVLAFKKEHKI